MAQSSGFFNSVDGDRLYNAFDFARYFGSLASNGIFYATTDNLKVSWVSGMNIEVAAGAAWISGYNFLNDSPADFTLANGDGTYARYDNIVVRLDLNARQVTLAVVQGVPAAIPTPPTLTRNSDVWELCLARISVPRNAASISAGSINDTRLTQSLCGLVNSTVSSVYQ
jgi:hypothetical protein